MTFSLPSCSPISLNRTECKPVSLQRRLSLELPLPFQWNKLLFEFRLPRQGSPGYWTSGIKVPKVGEVHESGLHL